MKSAPVTVVCSNVSNNCLGRALLLADLIKPFAPARVVGINLSDAPIWKPAGGFDIEVVERKVFNVLGYPAAERWLRRELRGSKVVVSKPLYTSLGLTSAAGVANDRMLLDVDDWELGLFRGISALHRAWDWLRPGKLNALPSIERLDASVRSFPHRTVSNSWLKDRFGGEILPHVRDTEQLKPDAAAREAARAELDMGRGFWVGFVGTIRKHKGVDDLLTAVKDLGPDVGLYLAGVDETDSYMAPLMKRVRAELPPQRLRVVGTFDFKRLAYYLGAADVLCVPSRASDAAQGQIPAKLFDAMSMGLPIIATDVNDMASILDDGGQVIPPGDVPALGRAIVRYRDDAELRRVSGEKVRARAQANYSYHSASALLEQLLAPVPVAFAS